MQSKVILGACFIWMALLGRMYAQESANLLPNGSFEVDADGDGMPDGWKRYGGKMAPEKLAAAIVRDTKMAHRGKASLRISAEPLHLEPGADSAATLIAHIPLSSRMEPGKQLIITAWTYMSDLYGANLSPVICYMFADEKRNVVKRGVQRADVAEGQWVMTSFRVLIPERAAYASIEIGVWGISRGTLWFDDLSITMTEYAAIQYLPSAIHRFDCGTEDSVLFSGFARLTAAPFTAERGYGWQGKVSAVMRFMKECPLIKPDSLTYDFVYAEDASFKMTLPNGFYEVILVVGDIGQPYGYNVLGSRTGYSIQVQGQRLVEIPAPDRATFEKEYYFKYYDEDWRKGYDVWERYIAPRFPLYRTQVQVTDGQMELKFRTCPVGAIIIYPSSAREKIADELAALARARRAEFPFTDIHRPPTAAMPLISPEDSSRGYFTFVPNYLTEVFPDSVPTLEQVWSEMKVFAAGNEYEPATFAIHALRDLRGVRIAVSDLKEASSGRVFHSQNVRVDFVRYIEVVRGEKYDLRPYLLLPRDAINIDGGTNKQVWLTIHVPPKTPAGIYHGLVKVMPNNAPESEVKLSLRVLPFDLPDFIPNRHWMISIGCNVVEDTAKGWKLYEDQLRHLKEHGHRTIYLGWIPLKEVVTNGQLTGADLSNLDRAVRIYQDMNMGDNLIFMGSAIHLRPLARRHSGGNLETERKLYQMLLRQAYQHAKENGYPTCYYTPGGSDAAPLEYILPELKAVSEVVPSWYQSIYFPVFRELLPHVSFGILGPHEPNLKELLAQVRSLKKPMGFSNIGLNTLALVLHNRENATGAMRFMWGLWFWRTGAQLQSNEFWAMVFGEPYNPFDCVMPEGIIGDYSGVAYPTPNGWADTLHFEWMREGVDDCRYLAKLEELMNQTKGGKCFAAAQQLIERLRSEISIEIADYYRGAEKFWPTARYDRYRWLIVRHIMGLVGVEVVSARPFETRTDDRLVIGAEYYPLRTFISRDYVKTDAVGMLILDTHEKTAEAPPALTMQLQPDICFVGEQATRARIEIAIPPTQLSQSELRLELLADGKPIRTTTLKPGERAMMLTLNISGLVEGVYTVRARLMQQDKEVARNEQQIIVDLGPF